MLWEHLSALPVAVTNEPVAVTNEPMAVTNEPMAAMNLPIPGETLMATFDDWSARSTLIPVRPADAPESTEELHVAMWDIGTGPAVTYLHGFPSCSLDWFETIGRIGEGHRAIAVDFLGFGASDKPLDYPFSIHGVADTVEAAWRHAGVTSTILAAHDYGASVCQELLARHEDGSLDVDVTGVLWCNGGIYPDLHRPTDGQKMLVDPEHGAAIAQAVDEKSFRGGVLVTWGTRRRATDEELHEMWLSMDRLGGVGRMNELLHYMADRRVHAERWIGAMETSSLPMRFVWGDLDPVSGAHMIERVEERVGDNAVVNRMTDIGHWPPLEAPDEVAAALQELLDTSAG